MNKKIIIYIVLIIAIIVVVYFFFLSGNGKPKEAVAPVLPTVVSPNTIPIKTLDEQVVTAKTYAVSIINFAFTPASLEINKGDMVIWVNKDGAPHQVVGDNISSPVMGKGESFSQTFDKAGIVNYHCSIHPNMKGLITVK